MIVKHEHDSGYKNIFSKKHNFIHFLKKYINAGWTEKINEDDLVLIDKSFVEADFKDREADIIYRMNFDGSDIIFYVLLELQSSVNFTMPFRLLKYMTEMLKREFDDTPKNIRELKDYLLPAVIPIILYNGYDNWNVRRNFREYLQGHENFGEYVIDFRYLLFDLNRTDDETILSTDNLLDMVFALDKRSARDHMKRVLSVAAGSLKRMSEDDRNDILRWLRYIWLNHIKDEAVKNELLDDFEKGEITEMIYGIDRAFEEERIKGVNQGKIEGLHQGKIEGLHQGEINSKIHTAKKLLKRNFSISDIADITELSEDEILRIQYEINEKD